MLALQTISPTKPEIIIPAYGCPIVHATVLAAGKIPVFADVDPDTLTISSEAVITSISKHTGAVILVHEFGNLVPQEVIKSIRSQFNGVIIEDAASAVGSQYSKDNRFGYLGDMTILSGSLGKPCGGVHWGALAINNRFKELHKKIDQTT